MSSSVLFYCSRSLPGTRIRFTRVTPLAVGERSLECVCVWASHSGQWRRRRWLSLEGLVTGLVISKLYVDCANLHFASGCQQFINTKLSRPTTKMSKSNDDDDDDDACLSKTIRIQRMRMGRRRRRAGWTGGSWRPRTKPNERTTVDIKSASLWHNLAPNL